MRKISCVLEQLEVAFNNVISFTLTLDPSVWWESEALAHPGSGIKGQFNAWVFSGRQWGGLGENKDILKKAFRIEKLNELYNVFSSLFVERHNMKEILQLVGTSCAKLTWIIININTFNWMDLGLQICHILVTSFLLFVHDLGGLRKLVKFVPILL
jgi:hypothetical protein